MTATPLTSLQRTEAALSHREPDRVPLFLMLTTHGARALGMSIEAYFTRAEHVVEGQLRMRRAYHNDCLYPFCYAAQEVEAWGGEVIFSDNGPPNAGQPCIARPEQIRTLEPPDIAAAPSLLRVLEATRQLHERSRGEAPIVGVVMGPCSLPVMQLGFEPYLRLIEEQPALFERLMALNEAFCVAWARAQLAAGATAICFYDPMSSTTMVAPEWARRTSLPIARRTLSRIPGPTLFHFASGRCLPLAADLPATGAAAVGVSVQEDLGALKAAFAGKLCVAGNLNGITMRRWSQAEAEAAVKAAIAAAGPGGGFILSDNHGEIPFQVAEETLLAIAEAAHRWGSYPLSWARPDA
jgi:uroporphyrinogen decarboxylase